MYFLVFRWLYFITGKPARPVSFDALCYEKVISDLAIVNVYLDSSLVTRMRQQVRVTMSDKLSLLGKA